MPVKQGKNREKRTKVGKCSPPKETKWKPGESGNPKGRPPNEQALTPRLREEMDAQPPPAVRRRYGLPDNSTWQDAQVLALLVNAARGNATAIRELWDRLDGKLTERIELTDDQQVRERLQAARKRVADRRSGETNAP